MASIKQKKFVMNLARGLNQTDAIIKAGYNVKSRQEASSLAVATLKSKKIKDLLVNSDISEDKAVKVLAEALQANKPIMDRKGELTDTWPDHLIRLKSAELYFKLLGLLGNTATQAPQLPPEIKVQFIKVDGHSKKKTILKTI